RPAAGHRRGGAPGWGDYAGGFGAVTVNAARVLKSPLLWTGALFAALLFGMPLLAPIFRWGFPQVQPAVFARGSFVELFLSHAGMVLAASLAATAIGIALAVFATRPAGR